MNVLMKILTLSVKSFFFWSGVVLVLISKLQKETNCQQVTSAGRSVWVLFLGFCLVLFPRTILAFRRCDGGFFSLIISSNISDFYFRIVIS